LAEHIAGHEFPSKGRRAKLTAVHQLLALPARPRAARALRQLFQAHHA
jgi:hypothetical protein